ncbi:MAG: pseudouridine-5'-phosphate glycosidase [Anaerolineales bacterium]|nr:pseudouridine-5'-phosphate glycosidase [Anaerolineales bacterium]
MPPSNFTISHEINRALSLSLPIVALETTVVTHGLPRPQNLSLARDMESTVREDGAVPATIGVLKGKIRIGMSAADLDELANDPEPRKISQRDFAIAAVKAENGGTTVAGTMFAAHQAGIKVFATGGIGGVHKESAFDISTDLQALATIPMIVVCAGAKSILDLPATLEYLETMAVPVVGYQTEAFPAFYSRDSGLKVSVKLDTPDEIVKLAGAHWEMGMRSAVLVTQPVPPGDEIPKSVMDAYILQASQEAVEKKKRGQELTPFLLQRIGELSNGRSVHTNLALLLNNARLAAQIARSLAITQRRKYV